MTNKSITGIVTWLKGWFFDKDEITSKEQALQTQINNRALSSDLQTTNGNVTALESRVSVLEGVKFVKVVTTLPTASKTTMNTLYVVTGSVTSDGDDFGMYITYQKGSGYAWERVDDAVLKGFVTRTEGDTVYAPKNHASTSDTYGKATGNLNLNDTSPEYYGHVKLVRNLNQENYIAGHALSAEQGKVLKDLIDDLNYEVSEVNAEDIPFSPSQDWGEAQQVVNKVATALNYMMGEMTYMPYKNEAIKDIELVPKSTDSTGAIKLIFADE